MNVDISLHLYADVETVNMILYVTYHNNYQTEGYEHTKFSNTICDVVSFSLFIRHDCTV